MKLLSSNSKTITFKTETFEVCEGVNLVCKYENEKLVSEEMPDKYGKEFLYVTNIEEFKKDIKEILFNDIFTFKSVSFTRRFRWNFLEEFKNGIDENRIIQIDNHSNEFFDRFGRRFPMLVHCTWVNRFWQNDTLYNYNWEPLKEHLCNHPNVRDFSEVFVPLQYAEFRGQLALDFKIIWEPEWRWVSNPCFHGDDFLGIKQFKLK